MRLSPEVEHGDSHRRIVIVGSPARVIKTLDAERFQRGEIDDRD